MRLSDACDMIKLHCTSNSQGQFNTYRERDECSSVTLDRLRNIPVNGVELHGTDHTLLLSRYPDQQQPLHCLISSVVYYLTSFQCAVSVKYFLW